LNQIKKRSPLWYELPLLFAIVGGVIAYFIIRKDDPKRARNCLYIGIILSIALPFFIGGQIVFGTQNPFYIVSSGSMAPELQVFDVLIVDSRSYPFESITVGDVIVFNRPAGQDRVIVQRVVEIIDDDPFTVRTKGDANPASIPGTDFPITEEEYIGKVAYVIPQMGYITRVLTPPLIYIIQAVILSIPIIQHIKFKKQQA